MLFFLEQLGGRKDFRKGFDLLEKALQYISSDIKDSVLVLFGESTNLYSSN